MDEDDIQRALGDSKDPRLRNMFASLRDAENGDEIREKMYNHIRRYHIYRAETLYELDNKIERLEKKVFGNQRSSLTVRAQQMLILYELGVFDSSIFKKISSNKKKAKLLATLLNSSSDNIEGDLSILNLKTSPLRSLVNLEFAQKVFEEAGLNEKVKEIEAEITQMNRAKKPK